MQYKKVTDYVYYKNLAYAVLRTNFPKSNIYIVNRQLIIIDGERHVLTDQNAAIFDKSTLAIRKAFRILRGNHIYSNL